MARPSTVLTNKKSVQSSNLMIDKISGKVAYAVLTFGGFMGFGEDFSRSVVDVKIRHEAWRVSAGRNQGSA
jgi:hypothetical protein